MAKKMDDLTKAKLFYSGELILIAILLIVIATLELLGVLKISDNHRTIFNWITLFGGLWIVIDTIWSLISPKKRAKTCLLDKFTLLPLALYLITFDLLSITKVIKEPSLFQIMIPCALLYIAIAYTFQGIYHWFKPLESLVEAAKEDAKNSETKEETNKQ